MLRLITGELRPDNGSIKTAGRIDFLMQTQDDLEGKSGGERTQIRLAELFRRNPEILLLDEPTNNLDHESQAWLLKKLHEYHGLALIVSHDRNFLQTVASKIIYLHDNQAEIFLGDYTSFCKQRARIRREQLRNYEKTQRERRKLEQQLKNASDRANKSNRRSYNKISNESKLYYNYQRGAVQNNAGKALRSTKSRIAQITTVEKPIKRKTYSAKV